jgi:class 3 adenylate cyclase/alpha-beta hydrolase superfamily lysophospholipase
MRPATRYAKSNDIHIAYQVVGDGPIDLVWAPGYISHVESAWDEPSHAGFIRRLATFSRVIRFDKRGTGLSDRSVAVPTLEERMDDVRAVMDAVGCERAALFGENDGGPMCVLFAASYPERTLALALYATFARHVAAPDYPWPLQREERERNVRRIIQQWGEPVLLEIMAPSKAGDERFRQWWAAYLRLGASPGAALGLFMMNSEIDVRPLLPAIQTPTLVVHRTGDRVRKVGEGRYIAAQIPGARFMELPGVDHLPYLGDTEGLVGELEEFLTGVRHGPEPHRVLATVLFTDIVDSTLHAAALGDRRWRDMKAQYLSLARREIDRYHGQLVDTAGDGVFATFDGPARAIRCGRAISDGMRPLGVALRVGLHTGEVESAGEGVSGIAVHIGARVMALAGPGEVLVSSTVKDLVAGSGIQFRDRGGHELKGMPGEWRLYEALSDA